MQRQSPAARNLRRKIREIKMHRLRIVNEKDFQTFWQGMGGYLWATFAGVEDHSMAPDELELTDVQIVKLKACPGWNDPNAPGNTPHPLIIE